MLIYSLVRAESEDVNKFLIDTEYMPKGIDIITYGELSEKLIATAILRWFGWRKIAIHEFFS